MNKPELKDLFDRLSGHYKNQVDQGEWEDLPLTIAEIDEVYQHLNLAILDVTDKYAFDGLNPKSKASVMDFTMLLDKLSEYYAEGSGLVNDLDEQDSESLSDFFDKLADYYFWGEGEDDEGADELLEVYTKLTEVFSGKQNEYNMLSNEEIAELFDAIENEEEWEFEYEEEMYYDWVDMMDLLEEEKEDYQDKLYDQMFEYEEMEQDQQEIFDEEYQDLEDEIEQLYDELEMEQERYDDLEDLLYEQMDMLDLDEMDYDESNLGYDDMQAMYYFMEAIKDLEDH